MGATLNPYKAPFHPYGAPFNPYGTPLYQHGAPFKIMLTLNPYWPQYMLQNLLKIMYARFYTE